MKDSLRKIASFDLVRYLVKAWLLLIAFFERIWSNLKYRALVKNCSNSICHYSVEIKFGERISVGENSRIGGGCTLGGYGGIEIGKNVVISKHVLIETGGLDMKQGPPYLNHTGEKIRIGDNVWIGTHAIILGGVTIGENALIGAGAIITKDVAPGKTVVGQPNRILN